MSFGRVSRREVLTGGAAGLISHLLHRDPAMKQARLTQLTSGGIDRIGGVPDTADYQGPGGLLSPYHNFITVAKDGGDFQTIRDALDYAQDASPTNTYCIFVYPGIYDEQITMKSYVSLVGLDRDVCIIQSADYDYLVDYRGGGGSINEMSIINERTSGPATAVYMPWGIMGLIDSCHLQAQTNDGVNPAIALDIQGENWPYQVLGTYLSAQNGADNGPAYCVRLLPGGNVTDGYIKDCILDIPITGRSYGIYANENAPIGAVLTKVEHCYIELWNYDDAQYGIYATGQQVSLYVEHTTIHSESTNGGGYDITAVSDATIYVRADRYQNWAVTDGGQILPLAGDRPRLECKNDATAFNIVAGAGVYQNDPNATFTIDLPCQSDLLLNASIQWISDTQRTISFRAQLLVDGVVAGSTIGYAAQPLADGYNIYSLDLCKGNLATGLHTITLEASRFNAADAVSITRRQITAMSDPWP